MQMSVGTLDHYNVSTRKFQETVRFYQDVLGFVNGFFCAIPTTWRSS